MTDQTRCERGSAWRQLDLHVNTPASLLWRGTRFDSDSNPPAKKALVDEMINAAKPAVFALVFDSWFSLPRRLKDTGMSAVEVGLEEAAVV